jgi:hypothetical protein
VAFVGLIDEQLFCASLPAKKYDIKMTFINIPRHIWRKTRVRLPTQLKLLIPSAIASGLLAAGTGSILRSSGVRTVRTDRTVYIMVGSYVTAGLTHQLPVRTAFSRFF